MSAEHSVASVFQVSSNSPTQSGYRADLFLALDSLVEASRILKQNDFFIENITCLDLVEGLLLVYHFNHTQSPGRICLRVMINHEHPEAPTISDIYAGANWHERECFDFFGITFTGHTNLLPLLLPADFSGDPPLRKKPGKRCDLHQLFPGRSHLPLTVQDPEFIRSVTAKPQTTP
ncbi:NADH-quinone oxidoreductase subunit C [Desulfonatronum thiosulfatophilum]|uniref:NADH-quinone oxidoreductase subunit C n=1 Tax=Desulfonatronum thiosulfatophilum TaxID=617002 RepID=A0A1G6CYK8_9BACT|nr:NADH-quinone oxidoreductase subunit C [Desulfonatronum thiosulfatophilum]SDB37929.1 NADH-quinone oxidoreductase subunit C [Desulfonatronum thiosulfatophilum]